MRIIKKDPDKDECTLCDKDGKIEIWDKTQQDFIRINCRACGGKKKLK